MNKLYSFYWDCGRQGSVEGLFIAEEQEIKKAIGSHVYFGEILGKHSNVGGNLGEEHLTVVSDDQEKIEWLRKVVGDIMEDSSVTTISGFNPLHYVHEDDEE